MVAASTATTGATSIAYHQLELDTLLGISVFDITEQLQGLVDESGLQEGYVNVLSRHTTTALCINENEERLKDDIRQYLLRLAPKEYPYLHNDIHLRFPPDNYTGSVEEWRAQEPENCHSHLLAMLIGSTETVPFSGGKLCLGTWQSLLLVELDGPRKRTVGVQLVGQ